MTRRSTHMPFFRCGGASISTIAMKIAIEKIRLLMGSTYNCFSVIYLERLENGFGVSNSIGTAATITANHVDSLRKVFEYFGYNVTVHGTNTGYDKNHYTLQIGSGDPNDPHYPGSYSGGQNICLFEATHSGGQSNFSFERKMVDWFRGIVGDSLRICYYVGVRDVNKINRTDVIYTVGDWHTRLTSLFTQCGYVASSTVTNINNAASNANRQYNLIVNQGALQN